MSSVTQVMRSMEKGDNEDDSDVLPLLESVSSCLPFDLITQPVLQHDKQDSHSSLSLRQGCLTTQTLTIEQERRSYITQQKQNLNKIHYWIGEKHK